MRLPSWRTTNPAVVVRCCETRFQTAPHAPLVHRIPRGLDSAIHAPLCNIQSNTTDNRKGKNDFAYKNTLGRGGGGVGHLLRMNRSNNRRSFHASRWRTHTAVLVGQTHCPITRFLLCAADKAGCAPVCPPTPAVATRLQNRSHEPFGARHNLICRRPCRFKVSTTEPPDCCVSPPDLFCDSRRDSPSSLDSISTRLCRVRGSAASCSVAPGHR